MPSEAIPHWYWVWDSITISRISPGTTAGPFNQPKDKISHKMTFNQARSQFLIQSRMKISVAQINYHIGNFERNKGLITDAIKKAKAEKSDLVIFSELCVPGYPPLDLLDRIDFIEKCSDTVKEIAGHCTGITAIIGSPTHKSKS